MHPWSAAPRNPPTRTPSPVDARRVHAQHTAISLQVRELTLRLGGATEASSAGGRDLAHRLRRLAHELTRHFADEEELGVVRQAQESAPRLSRRADRIVQEHGDLREQIERLAGSAELRRPDWERVREGFERFAAQLRQHEQREDELIQEAVVEDLGGGD